MVQWVRICLAVQGTQISTPGPVRSHLPQRNLARAELLKSTRLEPMLHKLLPWEVHAPQLERSPPPFSATKDNPCAEMNTHHSQKLNNKNFLKKRITIKVQSVEVYFVSTHWTTCLYVFRNHWTTCFIFWNIYAISLYTRFPAQVGSESLSFCVPT